MASYVTPKKNAAFVFYCALEDRANAGLFKAAPTLAAGDFKVSIDGGALANLTDLPTVTPSGGRMVKVTLTASEMNGDNITVVASDASGAEWYDLVVNIQTSAQQVDDLATAAAITALNDLSAADVLAAAYEGSETLQQFLRLARAVLVGKSSGGGAVYRDAADSKARVTATLDSSGNRTAVTVDAT